MFILKCAFCCTADTENNNIVEWNYIIFYFSYSLVFNLVTTEKPIQAKIYQVKQSEKVENLFKKKTQWELRELKVLDGKDSTRVSIG